MSDQVLNYINGQRVAPSTGKYIDSFNPATGEVHQHLADSADADIQLAVAAAKAAFPIWKKTSLDERSQIIYRLSEIIMDHVDELAELESRDQGKPVWLSRSVDIPRASLNFRFFSQALTQLSSQSTTMDSVVQYVRRDPVGVAGLISPWNLPLYLLTWKIAPAIAAGNTCVAKPSEITSATASRLCDFIEEAGFPPGVINMVFGYGHTAGQALVSHPDVPLVSFTGGTLTGAKISALAAPMFKKMSLEMGGKNANIIFADANLDDAVETSVRSSFLNQGEICLCGSRLMVERSVYAEFLKRFVAKTQQLVVGDPSDESSFMGPVASAAHRDKILSYIEIAKKEGTIACGGLVPDLSEPFSKGYFVQPTVVTDLPKSSSLLCDEIFGPVVTVVPFDTEDEAIAMTNEVRYGLSASIWTENIHTAHRVAEALEVGTCWVNTWMLRDLRLPFGGAKDSGLGREGGMHSFEFFTEEKTVCMKYRSSNGDSGQ